MSLTFHWFLPTSGDGRAIKGRSDSLATMHPDAVPSSRLLGAAAAHRPPSLDYLGQVARAAEQLGFTGVLTPTLAAQMAATHQRLSRGRLLLNVVTGGDAAEQRRFGDHLPHDERYARTAEFLSIVRGAWSGQPYDFTGTYYRVEGATVLEPPEPPPVIYFGGSSPAAGGPAAVVGGPAAVPGRAAATA